LHSASLHDWTKVFTDEWGGGLGARCRAKTIRTSGDDAIFRLKATSWFRELLQAASRADDTDNCVGHNGRDSGAGPRYRSAGRIRAAYSIMDSDPPTNSRLPTLTRPMIEDVVLEAIGQLLVYTHIYGSEIARGWTSRTDADEISDQNGNRRGETVGAS